MQTKRLIKKFVEICNFYKIKVYYNKNQIKRTFVKKGWNG